MPSNVYRSIHIVDNVSLSLLNWESPRNQNETSISFFDIILIRSSTNSSIHVAASRQTLSYKYAVLDGNYTAASITAVDMCGQRSDASEFQLTSVINTVTNPGSSDGKNTQREVYILAGILTVVIVVFIIFVTVKIYLCIVKRKSYMSNTKLFQANLCDSASM